MKTKIIFNSLMLFFVLASCEHDYEMLTTIETDGSTTRSYVAEASKSFILGDTSKKNNPFPFNIDTTWVITWKDSASAVLHSWPADTVSMDTMAGSAAYMTYASKFFEYADSMNAVNWFKKTEWESIRTHVTLEKNFRWFYTYYTYTDVFRKIATFDKIPMEQYLSEKEARIWLQDNGGYFKGMNGVEISEILESIEKKFNQWIGRNIFEEYYQGIMDNIQKIDNPDITRDTLQKIKNNLYPLYANDMELEPFMDFDAEILDSIFTTKAFTNLLEETPEIENRVEEKLAFINYFEQTIRYKLVMPGVVLETNARDIASDTLHWQVDAYRFTADDYTIYAKSKHMNNWVIIISFIILLVFIMSFINYMRNRLMP